MSWSRNSSPTQSSRGVQAEEALNGEPCYAIHTRLPSCLKDCSAPCLSVHHMLGLISRVIILQVMLEEAEQAPSSCRPALRALAALYGATRVERSLSFFLGCGAIEPCCTAALRDAVNKLCR